MNTLSEKIKPISFTCDGKRLHGMLHLPCRDTYPSERPPLVVGSHGLEGSMSSAKQQLLSRLLPAQGVAFFRFDHRGCGTSEGEFITETSLAKRVEDMVCAIDNLKQLGLTDERLLLFGSSLGGATCISAWQRLIEKGITPCGAVLCAAPVNSLTISEIPLKGNERRPTLPLSFFEEHLLFDLTEKLPLLESVLIFHGDRDRVVPIENAYTLHSNAGSPKKLIIFKDGDHQMSDERDQKRFEDEALLWMAACFEQCPTQ